MHQEKVKAIINQQTPRSISEVRSFHGLESFYKTFITNFSGICAPIIENIKERNKPFYWTQAANKSFKLLNKDITKQPILALPDFNKLFWVETDASGTVGKTSHLLQSKTQ